MNTESKEIIENQETAAMQAQLDNDPDYINWAKSQELSEAEKDEMIKELAKKDLF